MKVIQATNNQAPIILIYGDPGRGKSTLAAKFPNAVAMLFERGLPKGVTVNAIDGLTGSFLFNIVRICGALMLFAVRAH